MMNSLIGAWKLLKHGRFTEDGSYVSSGTHLSGQLIYSAEGFMNVFITLCSEPKLFSDVVAYSGRYSIQGDRVTHHIEVSPNPKRCNTDEIRFVELIQSIHLILRTEDSGSGYYEIQWVKREDPQIGKKANNGVIMIWDKIKTKWKKTRVKL